MKVKDIKVGHKVKFITKHNPFKKGEVLTITNITNGCCMVKEKEGTELRSCCYEYLEILKPTLKSFLENGI